MFVVDQRKLLKFVRSTICTMYKIIKNSDSECTTRKIRGTLRAIANH